MRIPRKFLLLLVAWVGLGESLSAQNALYVEHKGQMQLVHSAKGTRAMVEIRGKVVSASGDNFALRQCEEYLPIFVEIENAAVSTSYVVVPGSGDRINGAFEYSADFISAVPLEDVVLVLELVFADQTRSLFLCDVGRLRPYKPYHFSQTVHTAKRLGQGTSRTHLFVRGQEILNSDQSSSERDLILDRMVAKRITNLQDAPPKLLIGPSPEYPATLSKAKARGEASVRFRIGENGAVLDAAVDQATDPAFGEAALAAVRQWRFLPKVAGGRPVESSAIMPFGFAPPGKSGGKS